MKLESLRLGKFKENVLKKEQLFVLGGKNTVTDPGVNCYINDLGQGIGYEYGYDVIRTRDDGTTYRTYHDRSNAYFTICI